MDEKSEILELLEKEYKGMGCALNFKSPFEMLAATILSAQTTDVNVNKATEKLFKKFNTPYQFAVMNEEELEPYIKICGFYKTKSKNIIAASKLIVEKYNGEVPDKFEELIKLPGVGRKTANVVLSNAFGKDAIAVDTHVFRVSNRLGIADSKNVEETEKQLQKNIPKNKWSSFHHYLIWHGRKVCSARKPSCSTCFLNQLCKYYRKLNKN